jgi:hypothetical protein
MPDDLFYPTAAPTTIMIAKAHVPQQKNDKVFMARIWNDGFEKLKGKRVVCEGSQLNATLDSFHKFMDTGKAKGDNLIIISANNIMGGNEWSPQQWLPQLRNTAENILKYEQDIKLSLFKSITSIPDLADITLSDFTSSFSELPALPLSITKPVSYFFKVENGKSTGEKNYREGNCPYISSGDETNSIIRLVGVEDNEVFPDGGITVTAFGQAYVQPWPFMARGNGGSSVRVLLPRFKMNINELIWFAAQINAQKWRFFYARMAIKSRLERLEITSPDSKISNDIRNIKDKFIDFKKTLYKLSGI